MPYRLVILAIRMMLRLEPLVHREEIHIGKNITAPYKNLQTALEREKQQKVFKNCRDLFYIAAGRCLHECSSSIVLLSTDFVRYVSIRLLLLPVLGCSILDVSLFVSRIDDDCISSFMCKNIRQLTGKTPCKEL